MLDKDNLYTALFEIYHDSLKNFCISKGVRPEDIDDMVSEAFTRAIANANTVLSLEPPQQRAWLYSAVMWIMKEYNSRREVIPFSEVEDIEKYIQAEDDSEQIRDEDAFRCYVKQVYAALETEEERKLFIEIFDRKVNYAELAQKYGRSVGNMRVMVSRFRKKLRKIVNNVLSS